MTLPSALISSGMGAVPPGPFIIRNGLFFLALASALPALAQSAPQPVPGWLDTRTLVFYPLAVPQTQSAPASASYSGTWQVSATVTLDPSIATSATITGSFTANVADPTAATGTTYTYSTTQQGTMVRSGKKATLTLSVPYLWTLANATDTVTIFFSVYSTQSSAPTSFFTEIVPLPKNGATTSIKLGDAI